MAKATDNKRRREDNGGSPKKKQSKASRTPPEAIVSPAAYATGPPRLPRQSHGKVDAKTAKALPPPPMDSDNDLKPPTMGFVQRAQAMLASQVKTEVKVSAKSPKKSPKRKATPKKNNVDEESIGEEPSRHGKFNLLVAFLLFATAGWAGFVHQGIVQGLKAQADGHLADFNWAQGQMKQSAQERNAAQEGNSRLLENLQQMKNDIQVSSKLQLRSRQVLPAVLSFFFILLLL